jgi:hypothetical protein
MGGIIHTRKFSFNRTVFLFWCPCFGSRITYLTIIFASVAVTLRIFFHASLAISTLLRLFLTLVGRYEMKSARLLSVACNVVWSGINLLTS